MSEATATASFEDFPCACVARQSPKPARIERHHVWPQGSQIARHGRVVDKTTVDLCDTGHAAVHEMIRRRSKGEDFVLGNRYLRGLAEEGLRKMGED